MIDLEENNLLTFHHIQMIKNHFLLEPFFYCLEIRGLPPRDLEPIFYQKAASGAQAYFLLDDGPLLEIGTSIRRCFSKRNTFIQSRLSIWVFFLNDSFKKNHTVNSPVIASKPTWIVCSKFDGSEITGLSEIFSFSFSKKKKFFYKDEKIYWKKNENFKKNLFFSKNRWFSIRFA